jgi:tRNA nucleotidyltransferase (CCA-adding enzyme)
MDPHSPSDLLDRLRALPAARPLLAHVGAEDRLYVVGGAVRDVLLERLPAELDLVAEGDVQALGRRLGGLRAVHDRFGTATLELDGFRYDLARSRRERYLRPGALPEVEPAGIDEDLLRRDFTVNAIAVALGGERAGELRAAPAALDDIRARVLRVLHEHSFRDDPTRLLRLARYASRLDFAIEPETEKLAREAATDGALRTLSGARIGAELRLLAREPDPIAALGMLRELGLDTAIEPGFGLRDPEPGRRGGALLGASGRRDRLVLAAAMRGLSAARITALLDALAFSASDRDAIRDAATRADALARELAAAPRASAIAAAVAGASPELIALAGGLGAEAAARAWFTQLRDVRLEIDGGDLLAAGVPQGPAVGRGLRAALAAKLDGLAIDRSQELAAALRAAGSPLA